LTYRDALITAIINFENAVADNETRHIVIDRLQSYQAVCNNASDCLDFICYRFLRGFDRFEDWVEDSFHNATNGDPLTRRREFVTDKVVTALNRVHKATHHVQRAIARASDGLSGTEYDGTFDPTKQSSNLNTDAQPSAASAVNSMLFDLF